MKAKEENQPSIPFISDPGVLIFRDFTVGEMIELPFTMTNVSFGRNAFHFKNIDQGYSSMFNLILTPSGLVSPGVSVPLKLQFTPKFNSAFSCSLHFEAKTGPFEVRVECLPKIINIQFEPFECFDLGTVTYGEEVEGSLLIRNTGALKATWSVNLEKNGDDPGYLSLEEAEKCITFSLKHGSISGYSTSQLHIAFKPDRPSKASFVLRFTFTSPDEVFKKFTKDLNFVAVGADVPVFLDNDNIDFGVCFYDELYRSSLIARNRSGLSQRFTIDVPSNIEEIIEFQPKMGFIQPQSMLQIAVKLRANKKIPQLFPQTQENPTLSIPLKMSVVNQVLPVNFKVSFTPSPTKLLFDPPALDFGTLATTEIKYMDLKITSTLQVPVNFGFVRLPNGVSVQPFDGFGLIMPGESINVQIGFQSQMPKKHEFEVNVYTLQGSKFSIPCTATVTTSAVMMSATDISFEATPLGEESRFQLKVLNTKASPVDIEFETPQDFFFDPVVSTIPAGATQNVLITFRPTPPISKTQSSLSHTSDNHSSKEKKKDDKKKHKDKDKKSDKDKTTEKEKESSKRKSSVIAPDFTYKVYDNNIACFWRCGGATGRHHISIKAASVLPTIFVSSTKIGKTEKKEETMIDLSFKNVKFGVVALGQYMDATITIKNMSKKVLPLAYECDVGCFEVLSPQTFIQGNASTELHVRFTPSMQYRFESLLKVKCPSKPAARITLRLTGQGAAPSIDLSATKIDFGHVMVGQTATRSIQVKNNASFALKYVYKLEPEDGQYFTNMDLNDAFSIPQQSEWLEADKSGTAVVTFTPDHDAYEWSSRLIIAAGEDGQKREIPITASSWPHLMFIIGGTGGQRQKTAFDHSSLDEPFFRTNVICDMSWPGPTAQSVLTIGVSQVNDDIKKTNGEFVFDNISTPGFTVTPMKSSVEAGGTVKVMIEYTPPATSLLQVGQWVVGETAISLKCGEFNRKVPVKFKCLINVQQSADLTQSTKRDANRTSKKKSRK